MCGTIVLDASGSDLVSRVGNRVYEDARASNITINQFPSFEPILAALKSGYSTNRDHSFRVSAQRADSLLVLQSLARKWTENELTATEANEIIESHNKEYNSTDDFWLTERTPGLIWSLISGCKYLISILSKISHHVPYSEFRTIIIICFLLYLHAGYLSAGLRIRQLMMKPMPRRNVLQNASSWTRYHNKT